MSRRGAVGVVVEQAGRAVPGPQLRRPLGEGRHLLVGEVRGLDPAGDAALGYEPAVPAEGGSYLWRGELRLFDNEALMGWYTADEGAVRSRGTMYFVLHQHGTHMVGRWVGLSYDGPIVTGWGTMARTEEEVTALMDKLRENGPEAVL